MCLHPHCQIWEQHRLGGELPAKHQVIKGVASWPMNARVIASIAFGTFAAQSRQCSDTNFHKIFTKDLLSLSTCPSPCGWCGVVGVLAASITSQSPLSSTLSTLLPWSECKLSKHPKRQMYSSIILFASDSDIVFLRRNACANLVK